MYRINVGVIGLGRISCEGHIPAINNCFDKYVLKAVCNKNDIEKGKMVAKKYNCNYYTDYLQMLDNEALELIIIATYAHTHYDIIRECLRRKLHILVEKPLVTSIKSMSELCQYAEDNKILIYTSFQRRFNVYFNKISNIIKKKYIGDIIYCNLNNIHSKSEEYYIKKGKGKYDGGGVLINQAIHSIDMLLVLFENIEVNSAYLKCMTHDINCEDWAKVDMNSKETNISFWATTSAYREQGYELAIWGTNGHIKFSNNHFEYEYKKNNIIYSEEKEYFFSNIDLLTIEYGDIYEEITNDGFISEKLCKYETGLESIKIIEKVYNMVIKNE